VVSIAELRACGLSDSAVHSRVRRGWLHVLHRGVFAVGHPEPPLEGRFLAAVKACEPDAYLSHFAAAVRYGLVEWDRRPIDVTTRRGTRHARRGLRVHGSSLLDPSDVGRLGPMPITSPSRTLIDCASVLSFKRLRRAVRQAQSLRLVQLPDLARVMARLGPRRGTANLAGILSTGPAPTRTDLEDVVLDLILAAGLPHPDVNKPMRLDGRTVIPDFRWPDRRLVVEADSAAWHDNKLAREDDAERQALLEAHGERVVRVTWDDSLSRPRQTLDRLRLAFGP
jgi:hypothetical protein